MIEVVIPGNPDPALSPNSRVHWRRKAAAAKDWRRDAEYAAKGAYWGETWPMFRRAVRVRTTIAWARGRKRMDADNATAIMKSGWDGLTGVVWADDRLCTFEPVEQTRDPEGRGYVVIAVEPVEGRG